MTYNITVYKSLDNSVVHHFGPTQYIQQKNNEHALIVKELRTGLNVSEDYEVVVVTESVGSLRSKRKPFGKNKPFMYSNLLFMSVTIHTDTNTDIPQCTPESDYGMYVKPYLYHLFITIR